MIIINDTYLKLTHSRGSLHTGLVKSRGLVFNQSVVTVPVLSSDYQKMCSVINKLDKQKRVNYVGQLDFKFNSRTEN